MTTRARGDWFGSYLAQLTLATIAATTINATRPIMTYRALDLGATPVEIGLIQSSFSLLPAILAIPVGQAVDRLGGSRWMIGAMATLSLGGAIAAFAGGLVVLALAQVALGVGHIVYLVASQLLIANVGPRDGREVRFGWYATVNSLGQLIGPLIPAVIIGGATIAAAGSLVASVGPRPGTTPLPTPAPISTPDSPEAVAFLVAAGLPAIGVLVALLLPRLARGYDGPARRTDDERRPGIVAVTSRVLRRAGMPTAMFVSIVAISSNDVLAAYLPAHGEEVGLSVALVGVLLSTRAAATLVSRIFMGQLIARLGRSRLLGLSMLVAAGALAALPFVRAPAALIALMAILGLGIGFGQPMTIAWVANRSPRSERGTALGVRITGNRVALVVVPTLMGTVAGAAGISAIFVVMAIALAIGAALAFGAPLDEPPEERTGSTPPTMDAPEASIP
jgi:MFS family permease